NGPRPRHTVPGARRSDAPAAVEPPRRRRALRLLFRGPARRAAAEDLPPPCLPPPHGPRHGQARGEVDALPPRTAVGRARGADHRYALRRAGAGSPDAARPGGTRPHLLRVDVAAGAARCPAAGAGAHGVTLS